VVERERDKVTTKCMSIEVELISVHCMAWQRYCYLFVRLFVCLVFGPLGKRKNERDATREKKRESKKRKFGCCCCGCGCLEERERGTGVVWCGAVWTSSPGFL